MRRTTICRSEHRAALLALVAGLLAGAAGAAPRLAAQDTTQAGPDTSQAAQDTAPAAAAALGPVPGTHTVARGETLWSIAQLYFSDALLWPEIYRLNTSVVEDPHWIYPGEVLNLAQIGGLARDTTAGADTVTLAADTAAMLDTTLVEAPPPPSGPTEGYQTIFDRRRTATEQVQDVLRAYSEQPYRPLRRGEFYAAGFLSENERLPWGKVLGNTAVPVIPRLTERTSAIRFDQIAIQPPRNASYHVGDSLLVARIDRDIARWGDVVVPSGIARVTEVQRRQVLADVIMQFSKIYDGQLAMPLEPFKDPGRVRPTAVEQGLEGGVIAQRDLHTITGPQQVIFINRGRAQGVTPGDVFEIYRPASGVPGTGSETVRVVLQIVHTRDHSASGLVLSISHPDIIPGMPVRLVRKMPS
ncbi:MAG TPA: LysM domain-containing protein [Gemmatimonadales bacterium]|nr:LysM domain-containing protein [Gemmatimonadales bacterium]